ncbi:hypothetical protein J4E91_006502 [Alternaria rosae]|nr:hypothetical protein J4E91_006502 [Alternaria rosae]
MPRMGARLLIIVKSDVTEEQIDELGFYAEYGNTKVKIIWEDESDSDDGDAESKKKDSDNYEDLWADGDDEVDWDEDDSEGGDYKLRNKIYEHFINLRPLTGDAASVACINQQFHAEFLTLYLHRMFENGVGVSFGHVHKFLHTFFVAYPDSAPKDVPYKFAVGLGASKSDIEGVTPAWSLDLLKVVSVMRRYPLINVIWKLVDDCKEAAFQDIEVAYTVAALKEMSANRFEVLESAHLRLYDHELYKTIPFAEIEVEACLSLLLKKGATKQGVKSLEASRFRYGRGGIEVEIYWEELRRTIYEHFIDFERHPCTGKAMRLLWINQ